MTYSTPPSQPQQPGMPTGQYPAAPPYVPQQSRSAYSLDLDGAQHPDDLSRPLYGATFLQAVKRFFKQYIDFTGRASRSEYWWMALALFLIEMIPAIIFSIGFISAGVDDGLNSSTYGSTYAYQQSSSLPDGPGSDMMITGIALMCLVGLAVFMPGLALVWRRLHDANLPGWVYLINFVPYVGSLAMLVITLMPSKPEGRRFDVAPRLTYPAA